MDESGHERARGEARDAHYPEARRQALFPEGILTGLAVLCVFGAAVCGVAGISLQNGNLLGPVIWLLVAAFQIAVVRVLIGALYDIREYLARLNERGER